MAKYKDIKKLTGLSLATISRYFNNASTLSKDNIELIEKAIKNINVQEKKHINYDKIAIILQDITDVFYMSVANEISKLLIKKQYIPVIFDAMHRVNLEEKYYDLCIDNNYKGIIFLSGSKLLNEVDPEIPVLLIDRDNLTTRRYPVITSDNENGGKVAATYLIDRGAKRVIVIKDENNAHSARRRIEGFTTELTLKNIKFDIINYNENSIIELIKYGANAIFSFDDLHAIEAINLLQKNKIDIPKQVQVIGYDNIELSEKTYPSLTTITRQKDKIAQNSVKLLLEMIKKHKFINKYIKIEDYLIVRESTKWKISI